MKGLLKRFAQDASGATAVEYGLIAAGISIAVVSALTVIGHNLKTAFNTAPWNLK